MDGVSLNVCIIHFMLESIRNNILEVNLNFFMFLFIYEHVTNVHVVQNSNILLHVTSDARVEICV